MNQVTRLLQMPWLHVAGNHDLDFDAPRDEDSLLTYRNTYGPDTFAWEEEQAVFIVLDDVVYLPGAEAGLHRWAARGPVRVPRSLSAHACRRDRLLVLGVHIPLFDTETGRGNLPPRRSRAPVRPAAATSRTCCCSAGTATPSNTSTTARPTAGTAPRRCTSTTWARLAVRSGQGRRTRRAFPTPP